MAAMTALIDVDQLRTFIAIAECGSFTRAAETVNKTQSAVSMQMKRLEERLNREIFTRDGRASKLTEDGQRLLDYARRGGTVIVQYNKFEFNQAQYGPYPASVSGNRIADETVPVTVLKPENPVFHFPNRIDQATWSGWVQERGLYFLGEKDSRYVDLISMTDSFPDNPGVKLGSLVEANVGTGHWIYLGLGLWRQLPAGTDGAYQLLANLISLSHKQP